MPEGQKKPSADGRSPPQELEVGPRSGPYLLVSIRADFRISKTALAVKWQMVWGLKKRECAHNSETVFSYFSFGQSDRSLEERKVHVIILVISQELQIIQFNANIT